MDLFTVIISAASLLLSLTLGISEIRKRRSESRNIDVGSDTKIMESIKQAALDLLKPLQEENKELRKKLDKSETDVEEQKIQSTAILSENRQITIKLNQLQTEINDLKESSESQNRERTEWEKGISILLNQLVKAKIVPLWLPDGISISEIEVEPKLIISGFGQK